jgi:hypothetical protein
MWKNLPLTSSPMLFSLESGEHSLFLGQHLPLLKDVNVHLSGCGVEPSVNI